MMYGRNSNPFGLSLSKAFRQAQRERIFADQKN